jgi:hypothetical protein
VIPEPPLFNGAVHDTTTWPFPEVPVTNVGASGTVTGITPLEASEKAPIPTAFMAAVSKKYGMPLMRPVAVHDGVVEFVGQLATLPYMPLEVSATCT